MNPIEIEGDIRRLQLMLKEEPKISPTPSPTPAPAPRVPDQPDTYWWRVRNGCHLVAYVFGEPGALYWQECGDEEANEVTDDGHWLCPCLTPAEQVGRLAELRRRNETNYPAVARGVRLAATALGLTLPPEGGK